MTTPPTHIHYYKGVELFDLLYKIRQGIITEPTETIFTDEGRRCYTIFLSLFPYLESLFETLRIYRRKDRAKIALQMVDYLIKKLPHFRKELSSFELFVKRSVRKAYIVAINRHRKKDLIKDHQLDWYIFIFYLLAGSQPTLTTSQVYRRLKSFVRHVTTRKVMNNYNGLDPTIQFRLTKSFTHEKLKRYWPQLLCLARQAVSEHNCLQREILEEAGHLAPLNDREIAKLDIPKIPNPLLEGDPSFLIEQRLSIIAFEQELNRLDLPPWVKLAFAYYLRDYLPDMDIQIAVTSQDLCEWMSLTKAEKKAVSLLALEIIRQHRKKLIPILAESF